MPRLVSVPRSSSVACARALVAVALIVAAAGPALALEKANPSCGVRSKNPQGYDFCMLQTGQASSNPVVAAQPPVTPPVKAPPKQNMNYARCVDAMKTKQHMRPADASAYCMQLYGS